MIGSTLSNVAGIVLLRGCPDREERDDQLGSRGRRAHGEPGQVLRFRADRRHGAGRSEPGDPGRDLHRGDGAVRLRQIHADALHGRPGLGDERPGLDRRRGDHRDAGPAADPAAPRPGRLRLPGLQPAAGACPRRPTSRCRSTSPGAIPTPAWLATVDRHGRPGGPADAPAERAVRRAAAAGRDRPGAGQPAGDRLRRRADRQPRLPGRRRGPRPAPPLRRRVRPDRS